MQTHPCGVFSSSQQFQHHVSTSRICTHCVFCFLQAAILGSYNKLRLFTWSSRKNNWEESPCKQIQNFYTVTALSWSRDGSRIICGGLGGAVLSFEYGIVSKIQSFSNKLLNIAILVLKRVVWKDRFEIIFVGPNQVLLKPLDSSEEDIVVLSEYGAEIDDVKIMGKDNYLVARTNSSLIVADLQRRLISEVCEFN